MIRKFCVSIIMVTICLTAHAEEPAKITTLQQAHDYLKNNYYIMGHDGKAIPVSFKSSGCQTSYKYMFKGESRSGDMLQYLKEIFIDWKVVDSVYNNQTRSDFPNRVYINPVESYQYTHLNGWKEDVARRDTVAVLTYEGPDMDYFIDSLNFISEKCKA